MNAYTCVSLCPVGVAPVPAEEEDPDDEAVEEDAKSSEEEVPWSGNNWAIQRYWKAEEMIQLCICLCMFMWLGDVNDRGKICQNDDLMRVGCVCSVANKSYIIWYYMMDKYFGEIDGMNDMKDILYDCHCPLLFGDIIVSYCVININMICISVCDYTTSWYVYVCKICYMWLTDKDRNHFTSNDDITSATRPMEYLRFRSYAVFPRNLFPPTGSESPHVASVNKP